MSERPSDTTTERTRKQRKHPDAEAWDAFIDLNADLRNMTTLGHGTSIYLENRLRRAFEAGLAAARRMDAASTKGSTR